MQWAAWPPCCARTNASYKIAPPLANRLPQARILYIKSVFTGELVYDKRNVAGLPNAAEIIRNELEKRVHALFPEAEVRVKPMQANG